jgi:hypothetical protein
MTVSHITGSAELAVEQCERPPPAVPGEYAEVRKSRHRDVSWDKKARKWRAQIWQVSHSRRGHTGWQRYLGHFADKSVAVWACDAAARAADCEERANLPQVRLAPPVLSGRNVGYISKLFLKYVTVIYNMPI